MTIKMNSKAKKCNKKLSPLHLKKVYKYTVRYFVSAKLSPLYFKRVYQYTVHYFLNAKLSPLYFKRVYTFTCVQPKHGCSSTM